MRPTRLRFASALIVAVTCAALGCAAARTAPAAPPSPALPSPAAPSAAAIAAPVARGMDAAAVRRLLGEPARIERVPSSAARGAGYERWLYGATGGAPEREVVLLDGKVVDVLP